MSFPVYLTLQAFSPTSLFSPTTLAGKNLTTQVQQYNRHFRNLVAKNYPAYDGTTSKIAKRRIGVAIHTQIIEEGGRFLDEKGVEMEKSKAILKVMKGKREKRMIE
jgi:hypothetical protein